MNGSACGATQNNFSNVNNEQPKVTRPKEKGLVIDGRTLV